MYLSRKYTHESLQSIGRLYERDHASVFHAIQSLETKMKSSSRTRREVAFIEEQLLNKGC
jgi:chromosomal replication initiator protein